MALSQTSTLAYLVRLHIIHSRLHPTHCFGCNTKQHSTKTVATRAPQGMWPTTSSKNQQKNQQIVLTAAGRGASMPTSREHCSCGGKQLGHTLEGGF